MELIGTSTGFPFGPYSYTSFLGIKILDHVPYSIPLSWFYMGFTSYILASMIVPRLWQRHYTAPTRLANAATQLPLRGQASRKETFWSLVLGAYFLTVWDLALDPAMASNYLPLHFWIWHQTGPYFGMPMSNLVGWSVTGLAFMGVSRLAVAHEPGSGTDCSLASIWHVRREYWLCYSAGPERQALASLSHGGNPGCSSCFACFLSATR